MFLRQTSHHCEWNEQYHYASITSYRRRRCIIERSCITYHWFAKQINLWYIHKTDCRKTIVFVIARPLCGRGNLRLTIANADWHLRDRHAALRARNRHVLAHHYERKHRDVGVDSVRPCRHFQICANCVCTWADRVRPYANFRYFHNNDKNGVFFMTMPNVGFENTIHDIDRCSSFFVQQNDM